MRAAVRSSYTQGPESLLQKANTGGHYIDADDGQSEDVLAAEIADVLNRKVGALRQAPLRSLKTKRTLLHNIACGRGYVWYPQAFVDVEGELPRASRLVAHAWLEKAKHEHRRARVRRALCWLLVMAIGAGTLALSQTPKSLSALQSIGIEVAQLARTPPL